MRREVGNLSVRDPLSRPRMSSAPLRAAQRPEKRLPAHLRHQRVRDLEIGVDVLHVVVFVQEVDQLEQLLAGLVVDRDRVLRLPGQRCLARLAELRLQRLGDVAEVSGEA